MNKNVQEDKYGNPIDGDRLIYCCFPDCGCDGARLCMAERGANFASMVLNAEHKVQPKRVPTFDEKFLQECGIKKPGSHLPRLRASKGLRRSPAERLNVGLVHMSIASDLTLNFLLSVQRD